MATPQQQDETNNLSLPPHSTNPEEELPRVLQALQTVYNSSYNNNNGTNNSSPLSIFNRRDVADKYLTSFQRMPVAWVVCDRLLSSDCPAVATTHPPRTNTTRNGVTSVLLSSFDFLF